MVEVKWIKIVTDIFDDEKILMIETLPECDTIIVIWFKLLCLAGKQNNSGVFQMGHMPYTDEMFATIFRRPLNTVRLALKTFEGFGMIEIIHDTVTIPNWGKHQSLDQMENRKEFMRKYMKEYRAKQKELTAGKPSCKPNSKPNVSEAEEDIEKDIDEEVEGDIIGASGKKAGRTTKRFTPPTVEEVRAYCEERQNGIDPIKFMNHYQSNGWMVGRTKMVDWKAAVRTWEQRQIPQNKGKAKSSNPFLDMLEEGDYE